MTKPSVIPDGWLGGYLLANKGATVRNALQYWLDQATLETKAMRNDPRETGPECPTCAGSGDMEDESTPLYPEWVSMKPCPTCDGTGTLSREKCAEIQRDMRESRYDD